jgi:hypothetical protein
MKKKFRGMTLAAALLSASASAQAETNQSAEQPTAAGLPAFVGDTSNSVGDLPAEPERSDQAVVGDLQPTSFDVGDYPVDPIRQVDHGHLVVGSAWEPGCDVGCDMGCDSSCDGGCDSAACGGGLGRMMNLCQSDGWIRAEGLIMFMEARQAPPLVTSSDPGTFPVLPDPNNPPNPGAPVVTEFGDELDGGVSGGFRFDVGRYLTDSFGVGGRVIWLGENGDDYSASGNGSGRSIGRPYFFVPRTNPAIAREDAELVNVQDLFAGRVDASYATELVGAEAYARLAFCRSKSSHLEMIGGYSFFSIDDMLQISSTTTDLGTATSTTFASSFDTENRFHGGQLGFESVVARGCWTARALTKVHLGNMEKTVSIRGTTDEVTPPNAPLPTSNSSLLVMENQGTETADDFTFIPELNFTIGYRFRDHVSFTVGYNFLYFDSVALAGEQINRNIDTANLGANVTPAGFDINEGSLWIQGISLGASIDY